MVKVFKTTVNFKKQAKEVLQTLAEEFPEAKVNFDLEDCDNILRVESEIVLSSSVLQIIREAGFAGEELE